MTTVFERRKAKIASIALAVSFLAPIAAGAVVLPERAPIPVDRPIVETTSSEPQLQPPREVIQISTTKQIIPEARRHVRVVGVNFLPAADDTIDFSSRGEHRFAALTYAEQFVMATMMRLFDGDEDEQSLQVAATN